MAEKQISLTDLNPAQLQEVKRQLEDELEHLTGSFTALRGAQAKYKACVNDVTTMKPEMKGKELLVPLTSSLYVPGKVTDAEHVIVDIGTGYYVKKTRPEALTLYNSKITFIQENLDKLQATIERKQDNLQSCGQLLEMRMQEEQRRQGGGQGQGQVAGK